MRCLCDFNVSLHDFKELPSSSTYGLRGFVWVTRVYFFFYYYVIARSLQQFLFNLLGGSPGMLIESRARIRGFEWFARRQRNNL